MTTYSMFQWAMREREWKMIYIIRAVFAWLIWCPTFSVFFFSLFHHSLLCWHGNRFSLLTARLKTENPPNMKTPYLGSIQRKRNHKLFAGELESVCFRTIARLWFLSLQKDLIPFNSLLFRILRMLNGRFGEVEIIFRWLFKYWTKLLSKMISKHLNTIEGLDFIETNNHIPFTRNTESPNHRQCDTEKEKCFPLLQ